MTSESADVKGRSSYVTGSAFAFRRRWAQIDWRSLASVDVDRIAREMDFEALQRNIVNVTFCSIQSEEFQNVDSNFVKLFQLAQLIIEYLLHSQQYLSEQGKLLEQRLQDTQQELEAAKNETSGKAEELKAVKKENRKRRKVVEAYQDMMNAGATGLHTCPVCRREFVSAEYLQSHIHRRHPEHSTLAPAKRDEEKKLGYEELEQRLLEQMNHKLQAAEQHFAQEMAKKEQEMLESQVRELEEWKQKEQEKMKQEMEVFKEPIVSELKALQQEKTQLEEALQQKQVELESFQAKKQSHLGHLEGAEELDLQGSVVAKETKEEVSQMREQLESQLQEMQVKLKRQDKSWQKRMEKLSSTYQEQLKESWEKMHSLERSLHESLQQERRGKDSQVVQQLKALKEKVKQQELQLTTHQHQLTNLQSREPSPVSPSTTPTSPVDLQLKSRITADAVTTNTDAVTVADVGESGGESEEQSESKESQGLLGELEEVDSPGYTPFPQRPMIRTNYDHRLEILQNIRQETQGILNDALVQRGLPKNATGLTVSQCEENMRNLGMERQQRIQTHYNFLEHRERLSREVDTIAAANCVIESSVELQPPRKSKKRKRTEPSSVAGGSSSKPPKPTPVKAAAVEHVTSGSGIVTVGPQGHPSRVNETEAQPSTKPATGVLSDSDESSSEWDSKGSGQEGGTPSPPDSPQHPPEEGPAVSYKGEVESPWDSEDDSIEKLAAEHLTVRTSSTPIKRSGGKEPQPSDKIKSLGTNIDLEPDPARRPPGGVPVFVQPQVATKEESDSDDTFSITETSNARAPTQPKQTSTMRASDSEVLNYKPVSRTATSRSALTSVTTSMDDFEDSDLSDLEITRLT